MKARAIFVFALLLLVGSSAFCAPTNSWQGVIEKTPDELKSYGLPDRIILVTFPDYRPIIEIRDLGSYTLTKAGADARAIIIKGAHPLNFPTNKEASGGFINPTPGAANNPGSASNALQVELVPAEALDPETTYNLQVTFGANSSGVLQLDPFNDTPDVATNPPGVQRIVALTSNFFAGKFSFTLDAHATFDALKTPAFDYTAAFDLSSFLDPTNSLHEWNPSLSLTSEGTVKLDTSDTNINDYLKFSANGQLLHAIYAKDPFHKDGQLLYYFGFRLKALEMESDQQFKAINLTVKPQIAVWLPYSNIPALWWIHNMGITGNAATPLSIFAGYSYINSIRKDPGIAIPSLQKSDRLEAEFAYAFPLTETIRIGTRDRLFWLFDAHSFKSYEEVYARKYLDAAKTTSIEVKYSHGEVPPTFTQGDAASAGFSFEF